MHPSIIALRPPRSGFACAPGGEPAPGPRAHGPAPGAGEEAAA
jgi:hypothetical protein